MGFPICHMVSDTDGTVYRLVVVRSPGNWKSYDRYYNRVVAETSDDFPDHKNIYDTPEKAAGYLTVPSTSSSSVSDIENVSESKITSLIDSIYEGIPKPSAQSKISKLVADNG